VIDPVKITNFNANKNQLEELIIFWVLVAGKNAMTTSRALEKFLQGVRDWLRMRECRVPRSPFAALRQMDSFHSDRNWMASRMQKAGIGCYNQKSNFIFDLIYSNINLKKCSVEDLEKIKGIGPKTARCFLIHSRPNQDYAGIDTHILKFMSAKGFNVPKSTPTGKRYREIEREFIKLARKARKSVAEYDLEIWNEYHVG
jgi:endonuclease III